MKAFQERVVTEKQVLDGKLFRLQGFVSGVDFMRLPDDEQERLNRQVIIMTSYSEVLRERIEAFD